MNDVPVETVVAVVASISTASLLIGNRMSRSRSRVALNRALHELRRPLQAMALLLPELEPVSGSGTSLRGGFPQPVGPEPIRQAIDALRDLDREVNGRPRTKRKSELLAARLMADACVRRWAAHARLKGSEIGLHWVGPDLLVRGNGSALAAALENVILNAIEHGGPSITVRGGEVAGRIRIAVEDAEDRGVRRLPAAPADPNGVGDLAGHGFGLEIARETINEHGGRLDCEFGEERSVVEIFLPVARPAAAGRGRVKVNW